MTKIISAYHHKSENGYKVIAICSGCFYIYNAIFTKSRVARNLADQVNKRGTINAAENLTNIKDTASKKCHNGVDKKGERMSQYNQIKKHLNDGKSITPLEALTLYGCFRLGARIYDLKEAGMNIITEMVEINGKRFARYYKAVK